MYGSCFLSLFKLYFIDYAITIVPVFPFLPPSIQPHPAPSGNPHTIVHVHGSCICVLWLLYFLCCTLHAHDYSVTINLYFLTPSPFHSPPTSLPSGKHQHVLSIDDSVSDLLVCLFCFLDSIVDRYVLIAILLFIVLILFFLNKSL